MVVLCTNGPFAGRAFDVQWIGRELLIPVIDIERRLAMVVYRIRSDGNELTADYEGVTQP